MQPISPHKSKWGLEKALGNGVTRCLGQTELTNIVLAVVGTLDLRGIDVYADG